MAKKKKSKKRSVSKGVGRQAPKKNVEKKPAAVAATKDPVVVEKKTADVIDPRWGYVGRDVRRVGIIGGLCTALLIGIYILFNATGLDTQLYQLINI